MLDTNTFPLQIHLTRSSEKGKLMAPVFYFADSLSMWFTFFDAQYTIPPPLHQLLTAPNIQQAYIL